jgi:predicted metal-binding membrane protein
MMSERRSEPLLLVAAALLFAACATATVHRCAAMSGMGDLPMPGGWAMSMAWMRMDGQGWPAAAAAFLGMWLAMMAAMMLPSLVPMLGRYRRALGAASRMRLEGLTVLAGAGYFAVWALIGLAVFPLGAALAAAEMAQPALARVVPFAAGVTVLWAGALQFTAWKARQLACCRGEAGHLANASPHAGDALRHGLRLGLHCAYCCGGLTAVLLVVGVMDLRAMAAATLAISAERLAPDGERVARAIGVGLVGAGLWMLGRAVTG